MATKRRPTKTPGKVVTVATSARGYLLAGVVFAVLLLGVGLLALRRDVQPAARRASSKPSSARGVDMANAPAGGQAGDECVDLSEMCDAWHKAGACVSPGAASRLRISAKVPAVCSRTCGLCKGTPGRVPRLSSAERCRRDNVTPAVHEGMLDPLFERVMNEFPQFSPEALSKDPWVVRLHDFVSDREAEAFVKRCEAHFERSLAGDQLNPVRTSYQCWCNFPGCFTDPLIHRVTLRIANVTGTKYNNGEDMQIVRYEPGQFYRAHHDQNTAIWTPQGPRVLTFFIYLNTPEKGGGTRFPRVGGAGGITVEPRKGSAVLWPSTLDSQPMLTDDRTLHEAMPVIDGIKYGANMWVHQFDFKTPSERGCPLTYVNTMGKRPGTPEHAKLVEGIVPDYETTLKMASREGAA
mmetsp:Transcript_23163/g.49975  ORF Transcript_23163/g.49975 Transcript_23163/m.49975 type:complete len:408 (-) Transcript_23163:251-1474(-)